VKILIREYGDKVQFVGIADHSGCAEDPNGLNHEELLRLFHEGKCIKHYDMKKLSPSGVLQLVDTPAGVKARNTMHNRLIADAFVPCGGRPNTIDITNYRQFLQDDGTPTSRLIVEGANLFVTDDARQALFQDAGVAIVKDSSANKGGVITSSYEICAAMLLSEDEFFTNKEQIVLEVLEKLRELAKLEALLLFREFESYDGSLPEVSSSISNCINVTTDAVAAELDKLSDADRDTLLPLFRSHLPKTIADLAFDHVRDRVPDQYIKNAIASTLASKIVYKEGTKFIESQPHGKLATVALKYIRKEKEVIQLMEALGTSDIPDEQKKDILYLLEQGGTRTALVQTP
jgi:glutamate dehydrogenase